MELKEQAYLYDLYLTPVWRELFDRMLDEEVKLPREGRFLDLECGSGGFAIDLALRGGEKVELCAIDSDPELIAIAIEKARIKQATRLHFASGRIEDQGFDRESFDLIIADESLLTFKKPGFTQAGLAAYARPGAMVIVKLLTAGSFGEVFSIYWEALYELGLTSHSPRLESLIEELPQIGEAEGLAINAGLRHVHSVVRREVFSYASGAEFFASPLIKLAFLDHWLGVLPDAESRQAVQQQIITIIDRERQGADFDLSVKATLIVGKK
jgi:SAM-dependent methyltransferase